MRSISGRHVDIIVEESVFIDGFVLIYSVIGKQVAILRRMDSKKGAAMRIYLSLAKTKLKDFCFGGVPEQTLTADQVAQYSRQAGLTVVEIPGGPILLWVSEDDSEAKFWPIPGVQQITDLTVHWHCGEVDGDEAIFKASIYDGWLGGKHSRDVDQQILKAAGLTVKRIPLPEPIVEPWTYICSEHDYEIEQCFASEEEALVNAFLEREKARRISNLRGFDYPTSEPIHVLEDHGIVTVGQILVMTEEELLAMDGFGRGYLDRLRKALGERHLSIGMLLNPQGRNSA